MKRFWKMLSVNPLEIFEKGNQYKAPLFLIMVFIILGCQGRSPDDEIVARVGDTALRRTEMKQKMSWGGMGADRESDFIDRWVNRELLYQEAKRMDLDESVELRWELEQVEKEFLVQKLLERTFAQEVQITEEEIESYYEENKEDFLVAEDEVSALHILTKTQAEADIARQEIIAGKPFEDVARENSIGIFKDRGGHMGFMRKDEVIPEIERNAFRYAEGRVSRVFSSNYGFHILKVMKKRVKGDFKDLSDVHDEIFQLLRINKERSVYSDLLFQLQNKTKVYVPVPNNIRENVDTLTVQSGSEGLEE